MVTSRVSTAAAETILVKMEENAQKYVSSRAFGTIVLVQQSLWLDIVSLIEKAARPTKLQEKVSLDCTQSLMTAINPSSSNQSFSVTLTLNPGLRGT